METASAKKATHAPIRPEGQRSMSTAAGPWCFSTIIKAVIKKSAQPALDEVANVLTAVDNADVKIVIKGYADSTGSDRYNEALSNKRAQAVREYLMNRGIKSNRLATKALGSSNPVAEIRLRQQAAQKPAG